MIIYLLRIKTSDIKPNSAMKNKYKHLNW